MHRLTTLALALVLSTPLLAQPTGPCDAGWPLGPKLTAADTIDDNFDGPTLDPKWTATSGTAGTVDLFRTSATIASTYDLATEPGLLLMQNSKSGEAKVALRQTYTLCDGCSVVGEFAISTAGTENGYAVGLGVGNNETDPMLGEWFQAFADAEFRHGYRMVTVVTNRVHLNNHSQPDQTSNPSARLLIRIVRRGSDAGPVEYTSWYSNSGGAVWSHFGTKTYSAPLPYLWIFDRIGSGATQSTYLHTPIEAANWVCLGGAGYQPW